MADRGYATGGNAQREAAVASKSRDVQDDLETLRQDVSKLTQQLADLAAAKGVQVWHMAKSNIDGVLSDAKAKGGEAVDAVRDVSDNMVDAIDESLRKRPYTTLMLAVALGFAFGATWRR
jgi:ElaB/YqjD/DUF883 family membrane-anchored ribosome-binding protein